MEQYIPFSLIICELFSRILEILMHFAYLHDSIMHFAYLLEILHNCRGGCGDLNAVLWPNKKVDTKKNVS